VVDSADEEWSNGAGWSAERGRKEVTRSLSFLKSGVTMRKLSRRGALCGLSGAGLTALLSGASNVADAADSPKEKREYIVVGPFKLGEWLDESEVKLDDFTDIGGPKQKEIVQSLNKCLAYVLDRRICKDGKVDRFADRPQLLVTGELHHTWKTKKSSFTIQLANAKTAVNSDDYSASPPIRKVVLNVCVKSVGPGQNRATICFGPKVDVVYDISGCLRKDS
jgi:hypothetical protein